MMKILFLFTFRSTKKKKKLWRKSIANAFQMVLFVSSVKKKYFLFHFKLRNDKKTKTEMYKHFYFEAVFFSFWHFSSGLQLFAAILHTLPISISAFLWRRRNCLFSVSPYGTWLFLFACLGGSYYSVNVCIT